MLDIGTSYYTNSRIRCNAELGGYTGYAELRAAGMFLNLSTTRTDGGWMYFKINNDDYMQLSGSDSKVTIYKDTSISSNLTINGDLDSSTKFPLDIKNSTIHTEFWTLASFHQGIENSGSWLQFSRDGTSNTWQAGMSSDKSYVISASDATKRLIVNQNGNTPVSGNLDVCVSNARTSIKTYNTMEGYTSYMELEATWNSPGYLHFESNKPGAHYSFLTVKDDLHMYCGNNLVHMYKDTTVDGNLDVGQSLAQTSIKAWFNHVGSTGFMMIEGRYRDQRFYTLKLITNMVKCF